MADNDDRSLTEAVVAADLVTAGADDREVLSPLETIAAALDKLMAVLSRVEAVGTALTHVCEHAAQVIPDANWASVTLLRGGHFETAACTGDSALNVDQLQYTAGEGPSLEAVASRAIIRDDRIRSTDRWPVFVAALAQSAESASAFLSAPLSVDDDHVGALNLYSDNASGFDPVDEAALRIYTRAAEAELHAAARATRARTEIDNLVAALGARAAIEQCKGAMMTCFGVDEDRAFDLLIWRSQHTNVKARFLAAQVMRSISSLTPPQTLTDEFSSLFMTAHEHVPGNREP